VTGRSDSESPGRERPGRRSVPTGKEQTFFPSHSARRASFHYEKNDIDLSGIGTDRPARRRPAALDRPGTPGRARASLRRAPAVARGDMTDVDESAVEKNCPIQAN
jgi:hypothetical protein